MEVPKQDDGQNVTRERSILRGTVEVLPLSVAGAVNGPAGRPFSIVAMPGATAGRHAVTGCGDIVVLRGIFLPAQWPWLLAANSQHGRFFASGPHNAQPTATRDDTAPVMTNIHIRRFPMLLAAAMAILCVLPSTTAAQLNGSNIKGDSGLKAGSQAPPGAYVAVPLYFYTADAVKDRDGDEVLTANIDAAVYGVALNVVTTTTLLGGRYGFLAVLPWANNRVQGAEDFDSNPGSGITDMYVQPISLGWTKPRADVIASYGLFLPTGRYEDGAANNTGLGMFGQEILFGTTVYLNKQRSLHAATAATFDFFSEKKDSETKVGNILNLEGGLGADFLKGGLTAGLAYYGTFKLTDDHFDSALATRLIRDKNRVWGLGPEFTLALATKRAVYGFLTVRYQWELAARTATEGAAWNIMATFPLKPIRLPQP